MRRLACLGSVRSRVDSRPRIRTPEDSIAPIQDAAGFPAIRRAIRVAGSLWLGAACAAFGPAADPLHGAPGRAAGTGDRCGQPFGGLRPAEVTYLLASAREDTVPDDGGRPSGFGQLADVVRVSGAGADLVRTVTDDGPVVLVPWGFDEVCRPIDWTGSWRWATIDAEGFYRGQLRPAENWIDGRPTFDVHAAVWEGFPESPWKHPLSDGRQLLSAAELFDLYDRLPTAESIGMRPYGAVSNLVAWRRDAGDLADRYPARTLVAEAFELAELARLRTDPLPFAGTYRVLVLRDGETIATFHLRTGRVGSEPLNVEPPSSGSFALPTAPRPAPAFQAAAVLAASEADLESSECTRDRALKASAGESRGGAARGALHAWSAELAIHFVAACFGDAEVLRELGASDAVDGEQSAARSESTDLFGGAFRQEVDGRFTFRQSASLSDGTQVELRGDRIDVTALAAPPRIPDG